MADDLVLKVRADVSEATKGLAPLTSSLDKVKTSAAATENELEKLSKVKVAPSVNEQAIARARDEIRRLQATLAEDIAIGADTRPAQRRIAELQSAIRRLDSETVTIDVKSSGGLENVSGQAADVKGQLMELAGAAGVAGTALTGPAGVAAAAGAVGVASVKMAADMETATLQMKAVIRDGGDVNKVVGDLKALGASSPFAFPELQASAKTLLSFGVSSRQVVDTLKNLGEVASALGVPIEELSVVYGQMLAKGKIQSEEMLQLAERGVPAYAALAQAIGKTEAETRELVAQGKLGKREVEAMGRELGKMYGGSMLEQSKTFNGQMATLRDSMESLGVIIGSTVLPAFTQIFELGNKLAGQKWLMNTLQFISETSLLGALSKTIEHFEGVEEATTDAGTSQQKYTATLKDAKTVLEETTKEVDNLKDSFTILNQGYLDAETFAIRFAESQAEMNEALKEGKRGWDLSTEAGRRNRQMIADQAELIAGEIERMRAQGASVAEIDARYASLREQLIRNAVQFGLTRAEAEKHVEALLKTPKVVSTELKLINKLEFEAEMAKLLAQRNLPIQLDPSLNREKLDELEAKIQKSLNAGTLGFNSGNGTVSGSGRSAPQSIAPGVTVNPQIYVDGHSLRAVFRDDINTNVQRATVAATDYRRL